MGIQGRYQEAEYCRRYCRFNSLDNIFLFGFFAIRYVANPWANPWAGAADQRYIVPYIIGLPFSYILPWGFIKLIKWILDGFRQKEDIKEKNGE
ncbi:MAG: hypothetical protein NTY36_18065 [Deltaproteobacteria bacterium]|nr:hypothetical protein [Deltaproteobacteria bacterium]